MKVSVIIPAFNAEATLGAQLEALTRQVPSTDAFEVIVADNGSTDRTVAVASEFVDRMPVRIVDASSRRGPSAARNHGAAFARGDLLLFCDADDIVLDGWVRAISSCAQPGRVAVGATRHCSATPEDDPSWRSGSVALSRYLGQVPHVVSNNLAVARTDFEAVAGFDESLRCGEDADLGIRLLHAGCEIAPCLEARVAARDRTSIRDQFIQYVQYGRWDVAVYRKHRGVGLHRPSLRAALRDYASLVVHLPRLLDSKKRRSWIVTAGLRCGRLVGSVRERTFLP